MLRKRLRVHTEKLPVDVEVLPVHAESLPVDAECFPADPQRRAVPKNPKKVAPTEVGATLGKETNGLYEAKASSASKAKTD